MTENGKALTRLAYIHGAVEALAKYAKSQGHDQISIRTLNEIVDAYIETFRPPMHGAHSSPPTPSESKGRLRLIK